MIVHDVRQVVTREAGSEIDIMPYGEEHLPVSSLQIDNDQLKTHLYMCKRLVH